MSALSPIQTAVFNKLDKDTQLSSLITGVFDEVPEKQAYPYVEIGDITQTPFRTFGKKGYDTTVTLHIWNQHSGFKPLQDILVLLNDLLDEQPLTISGFKTVYLLFEHSIEIKDPDGITKHIAARYRLVVQAQ